MVKNEDNQSESFANIWSIYYISQNFFKVERKIVWAKITDYKKTVYKKLDPPTPKSEETF